MATTVSVDGDHASEPLPSTITENDGLNISSQSTEATPVIAESVLVSDGTVTEDKKWPGWPGHNAFRLIVPVLKVGSIIGRKGELVKKMSEETRARIRVLDGPVGTPDRIVLVFGKEEPESEMSPAMNAVIRIFKRVNGLSEADADSTTTAAATSSIRLLVASTQAIFLIGKQGTVIKSIQENSGASVRVLPEGDIPFYATPDERIVEIQGETLKVLKALEGVLGNLRRFLVDPSVIPLFEKSPHATAPQDRPSEHWSDKTQSLIHAASQTGIGSDYSLSMKREPLFLDREPPLESRLSLYGKDSSTPGFGRSAAALVTQVTQTMQIPLSYAEDIIGIGGANIGYIRRTSGAILTVQESRGLPDEITVEIKGTSSQVQTAQQLIQESISGRKEPIPSNYSKHDPGLGSYPSLSSSYTTSSLPSQSYSGSSLTQSYGGYGSSGPGGYNSYRF